MTLPQVLLFHRRRDGLTLVEILVAAAVSLIVILALVQLFKHSGDIVSDGRATIEMAGQIRRAASQVRQDLAGLTVPTSPWPSDAASDGYFEYVEGPQWDGLVLDGNASNDAFADGDVYGDLDDVLMFTARSNARPFVGRYNGNTIESNLAEIVFWTVLQPNGEALLYRRVLLIRPDLAGGGAVGTAAALQAFYNQNDVSVRIDTSNGNLYANSLSDLTKRENRSFHVPKAANGSGFPFPLNTTLLRNSVQSGTFQGEDVLLGHVVAFDAKVYDVNALLLQDAASGRALEPSDPAYALGSLPVIGQGAYVDLGYGRYRSGASSRFAGAPHAKSQLSPGVVGGFTFCTWSQHYERDGINQNGNALTDEGTDGLDNDGAFGIDDGGELETSPPYPFALRSLQIKIRVVDIQTQKVRQMTIQNDFFLE